MAQQLDCTECPGTSDSAFACLNLAHRARMAKVAVPHTYQRGQMIFYQGNPPLAVYCVHSGMVKLFRAQGRGDQIVVGMRTCGDLLGHRAVLAELPYGISAEAIERSVICSIAREDFLLSIAESHEFATHLLTRLAREFRFAEERLCERSGELVAKRTARFLVRVAQRAVVDTESGRATVTPTLREDLALLIGTTPETLSRTLHEFSERGLVDLDRKGITVLDLPRLTRLAE